MKTLKVFLSLMIIVFSFAAEQSFARKEKPDYQAALCSAAAAQMAQYPGREDQICRGYPGCAYVPPQSYGGDCVVRDPNAHKSMRGLCDYAASMMAQYPDNEARICMGFAGCTYVPATYSLGDCVPRR